MLPQRMVLHHLSRAALITAVVLVPAHRPVAAQAPIDWGAVDHAMGRPGAMQPGDVHRYGFPRTDLHVVVDGVTLKAGFALGSWIAFKQTSANAAVAMGDLVLLDREVGPVMSALEDGGIEITALHNHLLNEQPHVMYMHVMGRGAPVTLAQAIHTALTRSATPLGAPGQAAAAAAFPLDTAAIARLIGRHGKVNGGVFSVGVPRKETIAVDGMALPASMGLGTGINFQPTTAGNAAVTGDFVLLAGEVAPVMHALKAGGIAVTALHTHLLGESPHLYFMHFWANGDARKLAQTLGTALGKMNVTQ